MKSEIQKWWKNKISILSCFSQNLRATEIVSVKHEKKGSKATKNASAKLKAGGNKAAKNVSAKPDAAKQPSSLTELAWRGTKCLAGLILYI